MFGEGFGDDVCRAIGWPEPCVVEQGLTGRRRKGRQSAPGLSPDQSVASSTSLYMSPRPPSFQANDLTGVVAAKGRERLHKRGVDTCWRWAVRARFHLTAAGRAWARKDK